MRQINPFKEHITTDADVYYQVSRSVSGEPVHTKYICKREDAVEACEMAFQEDETLSQAVDFVKAVITMDSGVGTNITIVGECRFTGAEVNVKWCLRQLTLCTKTTKHY